MTNTHEILDILKNKIDINGIIYIGGSLARTILGIDNSFRPESDIDMYIFHEKPIYINGYVKGHAIASQYIPIKYHNILITKTPIGICYPVIDLNRQMYYIRDIGIIFNRVVDHDIRSG